MELADDMTAQSAVAIIESESHIVSLKRAPSKFGFMVSRGSALIMATSSRRELSSTLRADLTLNLSVS